MRMKGRALLALALMLAFPGGGRADGAAATGCSDLMALLASVDGYDLQAATPVETDGWCILDGMTLRATGPGKPNILAERLRMMGQRSGDKPVKIWVEISGLRVMPKIGDASIDEKLRSVLRVQTAEVRFAALRDEASDSLQVQGAEITLSGGTRVSLSAEIRGAGLGLASLLSGSLVQLDLEWQSDGRLAQPVMEVAGAALLRGGTGGRPVEAARERLWGIVAAMPDAALDGAGKAQLDKLIAGLPQGKGLMKLSLTSKDGISPARVVLAGLKSDPLGKDALKQVFDGSKLTVDWLPGAAP